MKVFALRLLIVLALGLLASMALGRFLLNAEIIYYGGSGANYEIFLSDADRALRVNLSRHIGEDSRPVWSPDGRWIAFYSHRDRRTNLHIMDADGRHIRQVADSGVASAYPAWSPDGAWIAYAVDLYTQAGIWKVRPDGSSAQRLTNQRVSSLAWSPDGAHLVFTADCDNNCDIYLMRADGSDLRQITRNGVFDAAPAWSPDGQQIVFMSSRDLFFELYAVMVDCQPSEIQGCPVRRLTDNRDFDGFPVWAEVGGQIAFSSRRFEGGVGNFDIYALPADCDLSICESQTRRLTRAAGNDLGPVWSPDGRQLAFIRVGQIRVLDVMNGGERIIGEEALSDQMVMWRPRVR